MYNTADLAVARGRLKKKQAERKGSGSSSMDQQAPRRDKSISDVRKPDTDQKQQPRFPKPVHDDSKPPGLQDVGTAGSYSSAQRVLLRPPGSRF